jgi:hypothetical protein
MVTAWAAAVGALQLRQRTDHLGDPRSPFRIAGEDGPHDVLCLLMYDAGELYDRGSRIRRHLDHDVWVFRRPEPVNGRQSTMLRVYARTDDPGWLGHERPPQGVVRGEANERGGPVRKPAFAGQS